MNQHRGEFFIPFEVIDYIESRMELVDQMFTGVFITRAEYLHHRRGMLYHAVCNEFNEVAHGAVPPHYQIVLRERKGGIDGRFWIREICRSCDSSAIQLMP